MGENLKLQKNSTDGIIYGGLAYTLWGLLPLYWKLLKQMSADEILSHRIIWSFVFVTVLLIATKKLGTFISKFSDKRIIMLMAICSIMIGLNWFIYIWAVNANHVIETSMGYYINPLLSVLLGLTVLKEKLNVYQGISLALASVGVCVVVVEYGRIPWIALGLAVTFALYGLLKKLITIESTVGLALETAILMPAALIYVVFKEVKGTGALLDLNLPTLLLLLCAGFATATPLLLFAKGAKRVELSTLGFLQYISPSITLVLGIFVFHEEFTGTHMISFGFIWAALIVFSLSKLLEKKGLVETAGVKSRNQIAETTDV